VNVFQMVRLAKKVVNVILVITEKKKNSFEN